MYTSVTIIRRGVKQSVYPCGKSSWDASLLPSLANLNLMMFAFVAEMKALLAAALLGAARAQVFFPTWASPFASVSIW
jgi:hypothetical protein